METAERQQAKKSRRATTRLLIPAGLLFFAFVAAVGGTAYAVTVATPTFSPAAGKMCIRDRPTTARSISRLVAGSSRRP